MKINSAAELSAWAEKIRAGQAKKIEVRVSLGTCGLAAGGQAVLDAIRQEVDKADLSNTYSIVEVGCMGLCYCEPSIELADPASSQSIVYGDVSPDQIPAILKAGLKAPATGSRSIERTWYYPEEEEKPDNALQAKIVLRNCGRINPEKLEDYVARSGYRVLAELIEKHQPDYVINTLVESGLRGRGGGGFPTGQKWKFAAAQPKGEKFIICNADEGDPGAFMDRAVMEGDPHAVLEAMAIGGYAIGADRGVVYIRAEYPLAVKRLQMAIDAAREAGLLGKYILGSDFSFDIELKYGAGAFVCGEETALIHSIEGKRGEPTFKPPFPAISGLWKKPTVVNNVETYANIPAIFRQGAAWFRSIGSEGSPGTKVFALAGKINQVGLAEVAMGTSLREIVYGIGGGIKNARKFKSVQTGGPSGGCITAENLDLPIDYENLKKIGSMMGSGGMIVMDEDDCMVNIARFFLEFALDESCGKCTPCRIGNRRLYEMLESICEGHGTEETWENLRNLSAVMKDTALCGLGQTSPNPVLSTMNNFEAEYMAHIREGRCPAGVCTALIHFEITDACVGCTVCARHCPVNCISGERKQKHYIDQARCIKCGACYDRCKFNAIEKQ